MSKKSKQAKAQTKDFELSTALIEIRIAADPQDITGIFDKPSFLRDVKQIGLRAFEQWGIKYTQAVVQLKHEVIV